MKKQIRLAKKRLKRAIKEGRVISVPVAETEIFYTKDGERLTGHVMIGMGNCIEEFELALPQNGKCITLIRGS